MENEFKNKEANDDFDSIFKKELKRRLKRDPSQDELLNSDNDADLVNETLWQLVNKLYKRVQKLEDIIKKP